MTRIPNATMTMVEMVTAVVDAENEATSAVKSGRVDLLPRKKTSRKRC